MPLFFVCIFVLWGVSFSFLINGNSNHTVYGPSGATSHSEIDMIHLLMNQETYFRLELEKTLHQVSRSVEGLKNESQLFKREIEILKKENGDLKEENSRLYQNMSDIKARISAMHFAGTSDLQTKVSNLTFSLTETKHNLTSVNTMCYSLTDRLNDFMLYTTHDMNQLSDMITHIQRNISLINMIMKEEDCYTVLKEFPDTKGRDGVYTIQLKYGLHKQVYCDMTTEGGGWTVIQRRVDGTVDFYRPWYDYKAGFGTPTGNVWLGNDVIYELTNRTNQELRIDVEAFSGETGFAKYSNFSIGNEADKYKLNVTGFSGTAGDSLINAHNGMYFSTKDRENDIHTSANCAKEYKGGWWYSNCHDSNLNGPYLSSPEINSVAIVWQYFHNKDEALKATKMMIRRNSY
ncbi:fibrinogen C domain-containing protein 1-A-like [Ostrea edulis]|uniref:fibrinogen C domain-containing protein 1-A-like n=1 Tax=Ostrea edulis TaxID=37623 RepID=UPI0024AF3E32|nr:fibrinogen C domain-containing protein 1-A-like [Ostrea edulis]